jgi:SH3-like domain-containing protein
MQRTAWLILAAILLLVGPASASTMKSIGKDRVNVRSNPNRNSAVLFQAYLGYPIQIEKQKRDWVFCTDWKDNTGWIYKPLVSGTQTAVILVDDANIRRGPSLKRPVVLQASKGEIYKIFGEKGDWVKVGYYLENEVIGWVRQDLVWGD